MRQKGWKSSRRLIRHRDNLSDLSRVTGPNRWKEWEGSRRTGPVREKVWEASIRPTGSKEKVWKGSRRPFRTR